MANIKQVAAKAGLSPSCVSKYLQNKNSVRDDTREKIEEAIAALHYVPSSIARSLRTHKTNTVKIITPSITNPFFANAFEMLLFKFKSAGYNAVLQIINKSKPFTSDDFLWVDGVILCFPDEDEIINELNAILKKLNKPMVCMHWHITESSGTVVFDLKEGIKQSVSHLYNIGCKNIAYVDGSEDSAIVKTRFESFCNSVSSAENSISLFGDFSLEWGFEAASKIIISGNLPDGIVCGNDVIAAGIIRHLMASKINVPNDIAVIGFDNIPLAEMYFPSISSFEIPMSQMTKSAVNMLFSSFNDLINENIYFTGKLIQRESTSKKT